MTPSYITMYHKLKRMVNNPEHILNYLNNNTRIVGGLVLQVILAEEWTTDIDIYTTLDINPNEIKIPGKWSEYPNKIGYNIIPGVKRVYHDDQNNIDLILISDWETVFSGFDFDFCKCWFNGKDFGIENPESVIRKRCTVNFNSLRYRPTQRIKKYRKRGFIIDIEN